MRLFILYTILLSQALFSCAQLTSAHDPLFRPLKLIFPDNSLVEYQYSNGLLEKVIRKDPYGNDLYVHSYEWDESSRLIREIGWFTTEYEYDDFGRLRSLKNPYLQEELEYDSKGRLVRKGDVFYAYDSEGRLVSETGCFLARYDAQNNMVELNGQSFLVDECDHLIGYSYDNHGNLLKPGFVYDENHQLIAANNVCYAYDAEGRRIEKGTITYLYLGLEEIGALENGHISELKIFGISPVAIEINGVPYATVTDAHGIVRKLIDPVTQEVVRENTCDIFGGGLNAAIPYAYFGKRLDPETGLIYFGKRYYDPTLRRWLTPDPLGSIDHPNLYQYVFNNPGLYRDFTGEFAIAIPILLWGAELAVPALSTCVSAMFYSAAAGAVAYGGYKLVEKGNACGSLSTGDYYSGDLTPDFSDWMSKKGSVDPSLPANPDDLLKRPGWKETTYPEAGKRGHRTFENEKTGEKLRHDLGKPGLPGHKGHDHYHRPNPNASGKRDEYLDAGGRPTWDKSEASHIYSPEKVWWK